MRQEYAIENELARIAFADSASVDAFSRLRVSQAQTLFEVQCQYNSESLRMESGNTGAGVLPAHNANSRMVLLQVNAGGAGGTSFMQSYQYVPYQPGKSHFIAITGVMGAATTGAVKRYGYGDASNGIFYEQNGTTGLQVNRRTTTSGVTANNTVPQANWNLDRLDGTGASGLKIDPTTCFILIIDLQYLGMGRVRVGFDIGGSVVYVHEFLNANILTVPYMQTATLPVMVELVAAAALGSAATMFFKCAQVASEAGYDIGLGRDFSASGSVTAASGARTHILSIRPATTFNGIVNRGLPILESLEILAGANPVQWELVIGAAFTVAPTFAAANATYSFMEFGTGGTFNNLTTGVVILSGFVNSASPSNRGAFSKDLTISYPFTLDRAGAQRPLGTLSLLLTGLGGTSASNATMNWREIR